MSMQIFSQKFASQDRPSFFFFFFSFFFRPMTFRVLIRRRNRPGQSDSSAF
jgi:hypothetical protein